MTDSAAWAVVAAALGASVLTAGATLGIDWWRMRREASASRKRELTQACATLVTGAHKMSIRASAVKEMMIMRSGIWEGVDVALHHRKPLDPTTLVEYMQVDMAPMLDAQATIWILGDQQLIAGASGIILAAAEVVSKSTALPEDRQPVSRDAELKDRARALARGMRQLPRDPALEEARNAAVRELARACLKFGLIARQCLQGADPDDLWRAFPGLHDEDEEPSENAFTQPVGTPSHTE